MSRTTYHYGIRISPREHIPSDISPGQILWIIPFPLYTVQEIIPGNYPGKLPEEITGGGNVQYSLLPLMLLLLKRRHDVKSKARQILRSKQTLKKLIPTFGHQGIIVKQNLLNESIQTAYFMALEHSALHSKPIVGRRLFHIRQNPRPALRELREVQGAPAPGPAVFGACNLWEVENFYICCITSL